MFNSKVIRSLLMLLLLTPMLIAQAQSTAGDMREAALIVGNTLPFAATDGILRYDRRGAFIDNMIPAGSQGIAITCCMTFGPDENLYVSSPLDGTVLRFNGVTGAFIDTFIPTGSGGLQVPLVLLFHAGYLYVGDTGAGAIRRYDANTGAYVDNFIPDNSQGLGEIFGDLQFLAFGPDNNLYVTAEISGRGLRYDGQTGAYLGEFISASEGYALGGLAFGPDGLMYVGSYQSEVRRYNVFTNTYELLIPSDGRLAPPLAFGPDGNLYTGGVAPEVLRYDTTGRFLGVFVPSGLGGLTGPRVLEWKVKTTVCHHPPGNPDRGKTLTIGYLSARDHLRHRDTLGPCE